MVTKKDLIVVTLATFCLTATVFTVVPTRSEGYRYNAGLDFNQDGIINIADIGRVATAFGSSGNPTNNVFTASSPTQGTPQGTFTENLVLRGMCTPNEHYLVEAEDLYPNLGIDSDQTARKAIDNSIDSIYKQTYVYEAVPLKGYQVLGTVAITLNTMVSSNVNPGSLNLDFNIGIYPSLYAILPSGAPQLLTDLDSYVEHFGDGPVVNDNLVTFHSARVASPITVDANWRLAIVVDIRGWTNGLGVTTVVDITLGMTGFLVSVPIVD